MKSHIVNDHLSEPINTLGQADENIGAVDKGFLIETDVISPSECDALSDSLSNPFDRCRAGIRNLMRNDSVRRIASDDRLLAIAKRFLGPEAIPYRATLFQKTGHANWLVAWHQDTALPLERRFSAPNWGPWSTKNGLSYAIAPTWALSKIVALRIHLDASTVVNGPLRVIPKSHTFGVLPESEVIEQARGRENVECIASKGSVIAMRPLLIHASSKATNDAPRRVLHIEYADTLEFGDDICLAVA